MLTLLRFSYGISSTFASTQHTATPKLPNDSTLNKLTRCESSTPCREPKVPDPRLPKEQDKLPFELTKEITSYFTPTNQNTAQTPDVRTLAALSSTSSLLHTELAPHLEYQRFLHQNFADNQLAQIVYQPQHQFYNYAKKLLITKLNNNSFHEGSGKTATFVLANGLSDHQDNDIKSAADKFIAENPLNQ
jgi:hypothetical protein